MHLSGICGGCLIFIEMHLEGRPAPGGELDLRPALRTHRCAYGEQCHFVGALLPFMPMMTVGCKSLQTPKLTLSDLISPNRCLSLQEVVSRPEVGAPPLASTTAALALESLQLAGIR